MREDHNKVYFAPKRKTVSRGARGMLPQGKLLKN